MSILPGWLLSGQDDAEEAAAKNAALYNQYGVDTSNLFKNYQTGASGDVTNAANTAVGTLGTGLQNTLGALNTGLTGSINAGNAGVAAYNPLSSLGDSYSGAVNRYYDTLGLNGPQAAQAAQAQYVADPGQQYQIDQATQAAINAASRTGSVGGGSTAQGIGRDVLGIVNTNYKNYQDRLAQFVPLQLQAQTSASQGIAGANKTLSDIYSQGYGQIGAANAATSGAQAGVQGNLGDQLANILGNATGGQAQSLKDIVGGNAASNQAIAQAGQTDASNLWGLLGAGTKAAASAYGGKAAS